ncbi:hypothetical protein A6C57_15895 [Fibrella sp. ES10-3-2-2]
MTVHLLRTPDYNPNDFFAVLSLLQSFSATDITFQAFERETDPDEFPFLHRRVDRSRFEYELMEKVTYLPDRGFPLSWRELFEVCDRFRQERQLPKGDVVILLTCRPNSLNWFSATDGQRNAFVHTADWELFMPCHHKYPVAYQIWANILRMDMNLPSNDEHPYWHQQPIGCMNDFCEKKGDIALKLRTGDICQPCWQRLIAAGAPEKLILDGLSAFNGLREQMLFQQGFRRAVSLSPLVVTPYLNITLSQFGHLEVKMPALAKVLYLFYLRHPEGVRLKELSDHREELTYLYCRLTGTDRTPNIAERISRFVDPLDPSARNQNLSRANKAFRDILDATMAKSYLIEGEPGERYRINLAAELITLPDSLLSVSSPHL